MLSTSLTFNNLPFNGNTPYIFLPFGIALIPLTAIVLALSPSVNIKVQSIESFVPAKFASSNFGIDLRLDFFFVFFPAKSLISFALT